MIKNIKKKKGFTLIELIIVIAIIGILAAIAVPKFGDIQKNAKVKADIATAKTISDAVSVLVAQGKIAEKTSAAVAITATAVADADADADAAAAIVATDDNTRDIAIAAQIGLYLQSIPESSLTKGTKFSVTVVDGNAVVTVGNDALYPTADGDYAN